MEKSLIQKFFRNECTAAEASRVARYLEEHPGELEKLLPDEEWESFREEKLMDKNQAKYILKSTGGHIDHVNKVGRLWVNKWSVAASVLLCVSLGWWIYHTSFSQTGGMMDEQHQVSGSKRVIEKNESDGGKEIIAPDGSRITLLPGSTLSYEENLALDRRDFYLVGAARFSVVKDENRPFTVYAGGLATTALGTEFLVVAYAEEHQTAVELISGKVVVNPDEEFASKGVKQVYLSPGEKIQFDRKALSATLIPKPIVKPAKPARSTLPTEKELVKAGYTQFTDSTIVFNHQQLGVLFADLASHFDTAIACDPESIRDMYFTGTFSNEQRELDEILHTITLLNGLIIEKTDVGYQIK